MELHAARNKEKEREIADIFIRLDLIIG